MMKRILIFTFALFISLSLSAQDNTIRLTVSGEGATKKEATANALRSAIEQAFGTFVSSNIQILNDDIVKDEKLTKSISNKIGNVIEDIVEDAVEDGLGKIGGSIADKLFKKN